MGGGATATPYPSSEPYHLNIDVTHYPEPTIFTDPTRKNELTCSLNRSIKDIFQIGKTGTGHGFDCPLEYGSHAVEENGSKRVLKLALKVSTQEARGFPEVAVEFCNKVFTKEGFMSLDRYSYTGVFGVSPQPGTIFERIWVTAFASSVLRDREKLEKFPPAKKDSTFQVIARW
ncbi:hypothetical protein TWF281_006944 [Arthrobotrys megalospora]